MGHLKILFDVMKRPVAKLGLLFFIAMASQAISSSNNDHLAVLRTSEFPRYHKLLISKLGATPYDVGRVLVCPAFGPEYSVSVYTKRMAGKRRYRITWIGATQTIWGSTNGGNDERGILEVNTSRVDADISKSTAELLEEVWSRMLDQAKGKTPPTGNWQKIPVDSTNIEWYQQTSRDNLAAAKLNNYIPIGPKTAQFVRLTTELLPKYCKARTDARQALTQAIESDARKLLGKISKD